MRFHRCKMDDINQIIKELWIKTYKGGDIDTIRICSDDTTQSDDAVATVIARRVYNYRVIREDGGGVARGRVWLGTNGLLLTRCLGYLPYLFNMFLVVSLLLEV